jgi:RNA polymerase sigma-70 factor (family 1)
VASSCHRNMNLETFKVHILPSRHKLFRFALRLVGNEEEAQDIVQDVLLKMWDKRHQLDEVQNHEAWCMRITRNLSLDRLKSKRVKTTFAIGDSPIHQESDLPTPDREMENTDLMGKLRDLINNLPEKQRMIIQLRDVEGYSYQEIADIMEIDINQVKVTLFRARNAVKTHLLNLNAYGLG